MFATSVWTKVSQWFSKESPVDPQDFEGILQRVYTRLVRRGDVVVDIGAHVGRHAIYLAQCVGPEGRVYAFEPIPFCRTAIQELFEHPSHNHIRNTLNLSPVALGFHPGESEFTIALDAPGYSGLKLRKYDIETRLEKIKVTVETLDRVLSHLTSCRFVKIDAEGGELDILRGSVSFLQQLRPVVAFEFGMNSCAQYGVTPSDIDDFWRRLNYSILDIRGRELSSSAFKQSVVDQHVWDYFAIPSEQSSVIRMVKYRCRV